MADKNSQIRTLKTAYRTSNIRLIMNRAADRGYGCGTGALVHGGTHTEDRKRIFSEYPRVRKTCFPSVGCEASKD